MLFARPPGVPCSLGTLASRPRGPDSFVGGGWRSSPPPPPVVPASESSSALAVLITVDKTLLLGGAALALLPTPSTRQSLVWLKFPKPQLKKEPPPMKGLMERQESH